VVPLSSLRDTSTIRILCSPYFALLESLLVRYDEPPPTSLNSIRYDEPPPTSLYPTFHTMKNFVLAVLMASAVTPALAYTETATSWVCRQWNGGRQTSPNICRDAGGTWTDPVSLDPVLLEYSNSNTS
jgi:hypothetical protein